MVIGHDHTGTDQETGRKAATSEVDSSDRPLSLCAVEPIADINQIISVDDPLNLDNVAGGQLQTASTRPVSISRD